MFGGGEAQKLYERLTKGVDKFKDLKKAAAGVGKGTGNALKFGDNDLVLGLNKNGLLQNFEQYGGKGYGQFNLSAKNFSGQIDDAMNQAEKIRVNVDRIDTSKVTSNSGMLSEYGELINGYTNYELWKIKNDPDLLGKTVFYENGQIKPESEVFK